VLPDAVLSDTVLSAAVLSAAVLSAAVLSAAVLSAAEAADSVLFAPLPFKASARYAINASNSGTMSPLAVNSIFSGGMTVVSVL
jgi:uncharacterized protein YjbI with pentapeptide repeats